MSLNNWTSNTLFRCIRFLVHCASLAHVFSSFELRFNSAVSSLACFLQEWSPSPLEPFEMVHCVVSCSPPTANDQAALLAYAAHHFGPSSSRSSTSSNNMSGKNSADSNRGEVLAQKRSPELEGGGSGEKHRRNS